jgi:hypothetical protein
VNSAGKNLCQAIALSLLVWASVANAAQKLKNADCLACHGDSTLTKDVNGKPVSLFVDEKKFGHSIHGSMFACVDCHTDVKSVVHETPPQKMTCAGCHANAQKAFAHSNHSKPGQTGNMPAANCEDCHGECTRWWQPRSLCRR